MDQRFFVTPFAENGDRYIIPGPNQVDGSVSFDDGFGFDYQRELGVDPDAKAVPRDATNYLFYVLTQAVGQYQTAGIPEFITSADNGGSPYSYGKGVMVRYRANPGDPFVTYVSKTTANTTTPLATGTNWSTWIFEAAEDADTTSADKLATPAYVTARLAAFSVTVPQATTIVVGRTRYATDAEAIAGTEPSAAITPTALAAVATNKGWGVPAATTSTSGRTRYATGVETAAGTVTDAAVTPAGLASAIPQATTAQVGRTRYATVAEADAQAVTNAAVTPAALTNYARQSQNATFLNVTMTGSDIASSERIKDIFPEPFPYGMREVMRIKPVIGAYRRDYTHPPGDMTENRARLFLIAEQAGAYVPEAMTPDGTTYRGESVPTLDYTQFVPVLIAALQQEHRARVRLQWVVGAAVMAIAALHLLGG